MGKNTYSIYIEDDLHKTIQKYGTTRRREFSPMCEIILEGYMGSFQDLKNDFEKLCDTLSPVMVTANEHGSELVKGSHDESLEIINRMRAVLGRWQ